MGQAKLELVFTQTTLSKITEQLKQMKKISSNIKVGNAEAMAKTQKISEKLTDEQKLRNQYLDLEYKMIQAQNKGMDTAVGYAQKLMQLNKQGVMATQEEIKLLRVMGGLEDQSNKKAKEKYNIKKGIAALNAKEQAEFNKLLKQEKSALYDISNLRSQINSSELADKKKYNDMLNGLKRQALSDNFNKELGNIKALYNEERKKIMSLSELNASKNSQYLTSKLSGISAKSSAQAFPSANSQKNQLDLALQKAITNEWQKSVGVIRGYINASEKGYTIKENMWNTLKKINAQDTINNAQLKEQVAINLNLLALSDKKRAKIEQENVARAESVKKQQQMLSMMMVGKEGTRYDKLTAKVASYNAQLRQGTVLTNDQVRSLKLLERQSTRNVGSIEGLTTAYTTLALARRAWGALKSQVQYVRDLDVAVFNLGVVSKKSASEIENLKFELLEMGAKFPFQAKTIAQAMDTIGRTGISFKDNMDAIDDVMKLATASGEGLSETAGVMSKALVAFSLSGEQATASVNAMHSVVLSSPLTLKGLDVSLRNSANAFATLIEFTDKSGQELEKYKEDLLKLDLALTGGLARIGEQCYADVKPHEMLGSLKVA